jgi:hypothetical protein
VRGPGIFRPDSPELMHMMTELPAKCGMMRLQKDGSASHSAIKSLHALKGTGTPWRGCNCNTSFACRALGCTMSRLAPLAACVRPSKRWGSGNASAAGGKVWRHERSVCVERCLWVYLSSQAVFRPPPLRVLVRQDGCIVFVVVVGGEVKNAVAGCGCNTGAAGSATHTVPATVSRVCAAMVRMRGAGAPRLGRSFSRWARGAR